MINAGIVFAFLKIPTIRKPQHFYLSEERRSTKNEVENKDLVPNSFFLCCNAWFLYVMLLESMNKAQLNPLTFVTLNSVALID